MKTIQLTGEPLDIQAAASDKPTTFQGVAYTGAPMSIEGFGQCVLNIAGMELPDRVSILVDHENSLRAVAGSGRPYIENNQLLVTGVIARDTEAGELVVKLSRAGTPLQMSVGARPVEVIQLRAGAKVKTNGREIQATGAGMKHVTKSRLGEITICAVGADMDTSVRIAAQRKESNMELEEQKTMTAAELVRLENVLAFMAGHVSDADIKAMRSAVHEGRKTIDELPEWGFKSLTQSNELAQLRASRPKFNFGVVNRLAEPSGTEILKCAFASRISPELACKSWGEQTFEASRRFADMSMLDFIRAAGTAEGMDMPTNPDRLMKAAASMAHLPEILTDAPRRIIELQLQNAAPTWAGITRTRAAKDFRTHRSVRLLSNRGLQKLPKDGTVQHDTLSEETLDFKIDTYAKQVQLTRTDVINDDLGAFNDLPTIFANDSMQSIGDVFYEVLNAGQTASFFSSGNANLMTGGSSLLNLTSFGVAVRKLREMTDVKGKLLNLQPGTLVVPPALEATARSILASVTLGVTDGSGTANVWNNAAKLEIEGRIGTAGGGSDLNWYLFADQPGAMVTAFLNATTPMPVIDFFNYDSQIDQVALGWRVILDHGSARGESRLAIKSAGA